MTVTVRAPAKINLHLGVGAVREDGFHPLDTVYQAVSLYDDVSVSDSAVWSVEVEPVGDVDVAGVPLDESNIAIRAGRLLAEHHGVARRARISIAKGIPVAGGMAGGSADAAATLVALDRLWDLQTSDDDLLGLAAELGSDVPFALIGGTARGTGRGELVDPVEDVGTWWWVVVPDADGLATLSVYRAFDELAGSDVGPTPAAPDLLLAALAVADQDAFAAALRNDLAAPALMLRPDLRATATDVVAAGARTALLSGSGPTFLGLAADQEQALRVRGTLIDDGHRALVATGPVAGAHVVRYA
ncbi:4-(cytidine 5'-diphospho)-2-C-methyl-D-erythritol kinase [Marmoricola sp. RAF53]|uniref:4-(cytidine 5'-diphospho)-2-C-methyl-D-erythritol kinase n=1 Tax=Marmoricola sp. RAF53 TaxID=3233059 RepID=UPI003F966857